jgi:transcriptional regulator with XRE-family HTH domain
MKVFKNLIASNIIKIRKLFNLNQKELAEKAGVSRATIILLEKGVADAQLSTLVKVAEALNINLFLLFISKNEFNAILKLIKKENIEILNDIELINKYIEKLQNVENINSKKVISSKIGTTLLPGVGTVVFSLLGENLE